MRIFLFLLVSVGYFLLQGNNKKFGRFTQAHAAHGLRLVVCPATGRSRAVSFALRLLFTRDSTRHLRRALATAISSLTVLCFALHLR